MDCLSVKKLTGAMIDGEYTVRVFGHDNSETDISIHCNNMKSSMPKEYLTLPSAHNNKITVTNDKSCDYGKDFGNLLYIYYH